MEMEMEMEIEGEREIPSEGLQQLKLRHRKRVDTIIHERNLNIDIPDQSTQEWEDFANLLILEYESEELPLVKDKQTGERFIKDRWRPIINSQGKQLRDKDLEIGMDKNGKILTEERGIGSTRLLGDIIIGGTSYGINDNERNKDEYKDIMTWALIKWQIRKIEKNIIQENQLDIEIPDKSVQEWKDFATFLRGLYKKNAHYDSASRQALEDYLAGGIDIEASWNKIRKSDEYKALLSWALRSWRDDKKKNMS
jgi:hypothetical protein